jgi:hypothetical protein
MATKLGGSSISYKVKDRNPNSDLEIEYKILENRNIEKFDNIFSEFWFRQK